MSQDVPEPQDYIVSETTRLSITTGTRPRPRSKRRHPLAKPLAIAIMGLVLQRRFFDLVGSRPEIALGNARPQSCQVCGQGALERCSMSFSCQPSL